MPSPLANEAKEDSWIAAIVGAGMGLLLIPLYVGLANEFPSLNFTEYSEKIVGKWLGKIVSLSFVSYVFLLTALVVRNIGDFVVTEVLPQTPMQIVLILFIGVVVLGLRMGLEVFARTAEIFFPWILLLFIILVIAILPNAQWMKMQPVFGGGIKPIIRASVTMLGTPFLELVVFLMILPYVNQTKSKGKPFLVGALAAGFLLFSVTILSIAVLGADFTARQMYPSYILSRMINIGEFVQRIEVLMAGIWFFTIFFKATVCFYATALGLAHLLKLRDYRPLIFPLAMMMMVLSIVAYPNVPYFISFVSKTWTPYAITYGLVIPLILFAVARIRKKRGRTVTK